MKMWSAGPCGWPPCGVRSGNLRCSRTRLAARESDWEINVLTQGTPSGNRANPGLIAETPLGFSEGQNGNTGAMFLSSVMSLPNCFA